MVDGKWIEGLGPLLSVAEAARLALQVRFEVVRYHLPLALQEADRDPEHVHRLRVGTRRAGAALRIFEATVPDKLLRKAKRLLRSVRRAAGAARDWDVFVGDLLERAEHARATEHAGLDFLIGYGSGQRDAAQQELLEAGTRNEPRLKTLLTALVQSVHPLEGAAAPHKMKDLGDYQLRELLQELTWAAARNLDDYEQLHQVRILGKQLRYAVEVFASCYPPEMREHLYARIEEMQEILGLANDSHVAVGRLDALRERFRQKWPAEWKRIGPGIDGLLRFHRRRLPKQKEAFLQWWARWQTDDVPLFQSLVGRRVEATATTNGQPPTN